MQTDSIRPLYRGVQVVWYFLYLIETLLLVRFLFKLLGADPAATFTQIVYGVSGVLVAPFTAVFSNNSVSGSIFEWTTLLAMVVYWFVASALVKLFVMSKPVSTHEANTKLSEEEH